MRILTRLAVAITLGGAACSHSPASPSPAESGLSTRIETEAFAYRYTGSDTVDVAWQEAYHRWAIAALDVTPARRIVYNKYLSRQHMGEITGNGNTNAYADGDHYEIHTIWNRDNHEVVHLYSRAWGFPAALWTEGLAVAYQTDPPAGDLVPRWSRVPLHDHARQFLAQGRLLPIADLLTSPGFRRFDPNVTYPEAGSFVQHLIGTCGLEGIRRLYRSGRTDDAADSIRAQFQAACGRTIEDAEADWRAMLAR
jgi:hypothetical protein